MKVAYLDDIRDLREPFYLCLYQCFYLGYAYGVELRATRVSETC